VFGGATTAISDTTFHDNSTLSGSGGAIYIRDAAPMTLTRVTVTKNKAQAIGGGIAVAGTGSRLDMIDSHVTTNQSVTTAGGIYCQGTLNITTSNIDGNEASGVGGGIFVEGMTNIIGVVTGNTVSQTTVSSNKSFSGGGGLNATATASVNLALTAFDKNYTYAGDGAGIRCLGTMVAQDVFVTNGNADAGPGDSYGGGIYFAGSKLTFTGNVSSNSSKYGAAINLNSGTATFKTCFIAFNHAVGGDGGALRIGGGSMTVDNSTIFGNTADTNGGGISNYATLTITLTGVSINTAYNNGGGVYQGSGTTTVSGGCTIDSNSALGSNGAGHGEGGGIYNSSGTVTVNNSLIDYNVANYRGGGALNFGTLTVDRTLVRNNISYGGDSSLNTFGGGGIYNFATATVTNSILRKNSTQAQDGGGFYNGWFATATLTNVTFDQNQSAEDGGGLKNNRGTATLTNTTFSGNTAQADGGGVYNDDAKTDLRHVTFSGNSAINGGAIYNLATDPARTLSLQNTIIAKSPSGSNCVSDFPGSLNVVSQGYNLSDDGSFVAGGHCSAAFGGTDQNNTNPRLSALGNYGGATVGPNSEPLQTYLLLPGSPAIDAILGGVSGCGSSFQADERGVSRPQDGDGNGGFACDIGAVEVKTNETPTTLGNVSARLPVLTGDNALFAGFIITGTEPKKVIVRALGPSVAVPGNLEDPTLELYSGSTLLESNDNWVDSTNKQAIIDSTIPPPNNKESAIVRTLPANGTAYTAIVRGANGGTGIGVVEAYDLDRYANSKLANISTRGFVQTGDNILFAGTIVLGSAPQKVIIRALGPSLSVDGKLGDPTLELHDSNGAVLQTNDNWVDSPDKQAILDSTIAPRNDLESAIVATLVPATYTAVVRGAGDTSGIAVVEVYALE
jgi:hypothetical protein